MMDKMNHREVRAWRRQNYAQAQWFQVDQLRRFANRNCGALAKLIARGGRNPLSAEYRSL